MIKITWNDYEFKVIQYGLGIFNSDIKGHRHSANSYELHYIVGGEGRLITETKEYKLVPGVFFVTGPDFYHQQNTSKETPLQEIYIYLLGSDKKSKNSLVTTFMNTTFYFGRVKKLKSYFEQIIKEDSEKRIGWENAIEGIILQLLVNVTRLYLPNSFEYSYENVNINDSRFLLIEQAFIEGDNNMTLTELSDKIGVCERQTQRLLKKYYGKSFKELKRG
ncbi:MAG: AraC family ligand binding domain-containing protein [Lachnospiraceae bacterium]|nr:AraC family ligand binding domain-containing protein [Lachnospiraceae bacterium]